jgi:hypothetical protein
MKGELREKQEELSKTQEELREKQGGHKAYLQSGLHCVSGMNNWGMPKLHMRGLPIG